MNYILQALIDTNVASNLSENSTNAAIYRSYKPIVDAVIEPFVALATLEEIEFGMERRGWNLRRRTGVYAVIAQFEVIRPIEEVAYTCARLRAKGLPKGGDVSYPDAWIAATAMVHDLPVITDDADLIALRAYGLEVITGR